MTESSGTKITVSESTKFEAAIASIEATLTTFVARLNATDAAIEKLADRIEQTNKKGPVWPAVAVAISSIGFVFSIGTTVINGVNKRQETRAEHVDTRFSLMTQSIAELTSALTAENLRDHSEQLRRTADITESKTNLWWLRHMALQEFDANNVERHELDSIIRNRVTLDGHSKSDAKRDREEMLRMIERLSN